MFPSILKGKPQRWWFIGCSSKLRRMAFLKAQIRNHYWITCWLMASWVLMKHFHGLAIHLKKHPKITIFEFFVEWPLHPKWERDTTWETHSVVVWSVNLKDLSSAEPPRTESTRFASISTSSLADRWEGSVRLKQFASILCPIFDDYVVVSKFFQELFLFSLGEMIHFDEYVSSGLVQPPTRMKIFLRIYLKLLIPNCPKSHLLMFLTNKTKENKRPCNIEKTTCDFSGNHFQNHGKTWVLGLKMKDSLPSFPNNKIPHQQKPTEFDPGLSPGVWSLQSVQASAERWWRGSMSCARFWSRSSWCLERQKTLKEETIWILKGQKS